MKRIAVVLLFLGLFLGCGTQKPTPAPQPILQPKENNATKVQSQPPSLTVITQPKNARVRIMNIRPKYHPNIELKIGKYLIEVSAQGYERYKKWIFIDKPTTLTITLHKPTTPTISNIVWKPHNERFYTLYDAKNNLIWALQAPYIDYVKHYQPKGKLKRTIAAQSKQFPKIAKTKLDTLIYGGHFRYKGSAYLLKNNNALYLYHASRKASKKEKYGNLTALKINGATHQWRIPTKKEIQRNNPFAPYQNHFEVLWDKGSLVRFKLPVLYSYAARNGYQEAGALTDKKLQTLRGIQNVALIHPVRKPTTQTDKIIYNPKLSVAQKFAKLMHTMKPQKALQLLLGDPKIHKITYDKKAKRLRATVFSTTNNLRLKVSQKVSYTRYKQLKEQLLDNRLLPTLSLSYKQGKFKLHSIWFVKNSYQEYQEYKEAKRLGNINAYREFIKRYPTAPQVKEMQKLIEKQHKKYMLH